MFILPGNSSQPWLIAVLLVLPFLAFAVGKALQRLYFHPLSKYPGPLLGRLTSAYAAYHAWKGDLHIDMWRQHQRYGHFVRYAPNRLDVDTLVSLKDIYNNSKNLQKAPNYRTLRYGAANSLTMINKEEHGRRRRIISQGLSDMNLRQHEVSILKHVKKCFAAVGERKGGICDMSKWLNWMSFDIMGDVVLGLKYDLLGSEAKRDVPEAIEASNVRVSVVGQSPRVLRFARMDIWLFPAAVKARDVFLQFAKTSMEAVVAAPTNETAKATTVLSGLKAAKDPIHGGSLSDRELLAETIALIVAGADTTSTAIAATFFYLARHQRVYQRLQDEVRAAFASVDEIKTGPALNKLTYLRACVDEALRMTPPGAGTAYREVLGDGVTVDGEHLAPTVEVGVPIYAIHHNAEYFPRPFEYIPERWIPDEAQYDVATARAAFCPFSLGPRSCVGKGMALMEIYLAVSHGVYMYDFKFSGSTEHTEQETGPEFTIRDHITATKRGPYLRFAETMGAEKIMC